MEDVRCQCDKIVCQIKGNDIIIKCRHCKRYVVIKTRGILLKDEGETRVEFKLSV